MADVDALVDLLERWRAAGPVERVRVALDARRHIGALPAAEKRALAVEVARRVAPQLVPQIEDEDGDLSPEQVQALVDLLRRADDDDLGDLVTALRSGDVAPALALADDAMDVLLPPAPTDGDDDAAGRTATAAGGATSTDTSHGATAGATDGATNGGAQSTSAPLAAGAAATALGAAARAGDDASGSTTSERDEVPAPPEGRREVARTAAEDDGAEALEEADAALDEAQGRAEALEDALADEAALREQVEAASRSSDRWRDSSPASTEPEYELPGTVFDLDDDDLPDTSVEVVATVLERAEDDARRSAAVRAGARPGPVAAAPDLVREVPDGYRRRRLALQALRDGRLADAAAVLAVVRSLGRETDRAWVAGAALDAGVLEVDDLAQVRIGDAARARLARRVA